MLASMLIARGADVTLRDDDGRDALCWATLKGSAEIVSLLLAIDVVDADIKDNFGRTPREYAAQSNPAVAALLSESGRVDPNSEDSHDSNPEDSDYPNSWGSDDPNSRDSDDLNLGDVNA